MKKESQGDKDDDINLRMSKLRMHKNSDDSIKEYMHACKYKQ